MDYFLVTVRVPLVLNWWYQWRERYIEEGGYIMYDTMYELPPEFKTGDLTQVKTRDVLKILLGRPITLAQFYGEIERMTDVSTALNYFSGNPMLEKQAEIVITRAIEGLIRSKESTIRFGFTVLQELYLMEARGVPIDMKQLETECLEADCRAKAAVKNLCEFAKQEGYTLTEKTVCGSFLFPASYTELNHQLQITRRLLKHSSVLNLEKLREYTGVFSHDGRYTRLFCNWDISGTVSGRIQSTKFNVQGLPKAVRESCVAAVPGKTLLFADFTSEELVLISVMSQNEELIRKLISGVDLHKEVASKIFCKVISDVSVEERKLAKAVVFAYLYGAGDNCIKRIIDTEWQGAYIPSLRVKNAIDSIFPGVSLMVENIHRHGFFSLIDGTEIDLKTIEKTHTVLNRMIQGSAAIILKDCIFRLVQKLPEEARITFLLHDEIVLEAPANM
jgi:DNA polymerase I-like protein with 3'-5' exonuclease and polymerase domains